MLKTAANGEVANKKIQAKVAKQAKADAKAVQLIAREKHALAKSKATSSKSQNVSS